MSYYRRLDFDTAWALRFSVWAHYSPFVAALYARHAIERRQFDRGALYA
jgi:hypothetical protein